ncbi:MAG: HipA domain-containing protein [Flavobacteriaceae bacterium]
MSKKKNPNFKHATKLPILKHSGFKPKLTNIETAKKHNYCVIKGVAITGDAPKDIIRLYEYGTALKRKPKKWPIYIAKLGHKYYPLESITEQVITDIGNWYGFNLSESKLCIISDQIRFLSKYFIKEKADELYHGADLYAGYLNDKMFVDEVELLKMTQSFFTIKFTKEVLEHFFVDSNKFLYDSFMQMLLFDALIGNNDRHMYNWGVIRDIFGQKLGRFSPIYDSARGLLWNETESKIIEIVNDDNRKKKFIEKYCENSKPKIGIESKENVNHFDLIKSYSDFYKNSTFAQQIFAENKIDHVINQLNYEFKTLLSNERRSLITDILKYRFNKLKKIVT